MQRIFTAKDVVALLFSAFALMLSGATFYLTNVRVSDAVTARVVDVDRTSPPSPSPRDAGLVVQVAFVNSGNRDAIITLPDYNFTGSRGLDTGSVGGPAAAAKGVFPFVLSPKQIRLVEVPVPVAIAQDNLEQGSPLPEGSSRATRRFFLSFVFSAIDSSGNQHNRSSSPQFQLDFSPSGLEGLRPIREEGTGREAHFAATTLFR
ncbi:MAG TPA: hypothetical protein VF548_16800 [Allosphingosinicella sp.]|jgi:hypothetical protein